MKILLQYFPLIFGILFFLTELYRGIALKSNNKNNVDKSSLNILWLTIIISMFIGGYATTLKQFYISTPQPILYYTGIFLSLFGFSIRALAIQQLGKHFTVDVQISEDHQLKQDGLYSIVRNPSYTGALLSFFGLAITYSNYLSILIITIPIFIAFSYRISVEEKALKSAFGNSFTNYCNKTKRLIPFIY